MNVITQTRNHVRDQLEAAGLAAVDFEPDRLSTPQVVIGAGSPYLQQGETFSTDTLNLRLVCIAQNGPDYQVQRDIDEMIIKVTDVLAGIPQVQAYQVNAPMTLVAENFTAPAVEITTTITIERT
ncbi:hypothetical protein [Actinomyces sp.]|uniref:hypothetical protein n=1 Tax=Actinomyces sp. TaxID=29317 RepID=UPI00290E9614|nr:hypothetical protein [Actinomyces sp.]MDU6757760.1 hypothetical protein [Actinomyces sp.]